MSPYPCQQCLLLAALLTAASREAPWLRWWLLRVELQWQGRKEVIQVWCVLPVELAGGGTVSGTNAPARGIFLKCGRHW
jgi:hypothetical protein